MVFSRLKAINICGDNMNVDANYVAKHDKLVRLLNIKIEEVTPEYSRVSMPLADNIKNGMGVAHGGAIFALADVAFGSAANAERKNGVVSAVSSIEFLRPGGEGPLMAEARAVRLGGHMVSYDVRIFDASQKLIARAMCTGFVTDQPLPDQLADTGFSVLNNKDTHERKENTGRPGKGQDMCAKT